jgi:hypothetical protein
LSLGGCGAEKGSEREDGGELHFDGLSFRTVVFC